MHRKSDNKTTKNTRIAKREATNSQPFVRVNPVFINHYSGNIGSVPYAASGLESFGRSGLKTSRTGTTQVPFGANPTGFGVFDPQEEVDTFLGMTAIVYGKPGTPLGFGTVVTRSMFLGIGGVQFNDDQENNRIKVSSNPVFSPNYWMGV